jgi:hypothetical protein
MRKLQIFSVKVGGVSGPKQNIYQYYWITADSGPKFVGHPPRQSSVLDQLILTPPGLGPFRL